MHKFPLYSKRHRLDWTTDTTDRLRDSVGIFLDGAPDVDTRFELMRYSDAYISLREVVFDGAQLIVYRDPEIGVVGDLPAGISAQVEHRCWEPEQDCKPSDVIEEFVREILLKLGLIDA